jgi:NAD(P)-dependent dehydrogenase (short-subunit alcohol dehydrogenase family)
MTVRPDDPTAQFRLDGQTAIITGVGPGIGEHVARVYARAGANVVLSARTPEKLHRLAASILADGGSALPVVADAGRADDLERLVDSATGRFGPADVLFHNAASGVAGAAAGPLGIPEASWQDAFDVNVLAAYRLARALIPGMRQRGSGSIINVLSTAGFTPVAGIGGAAYGATKAALAMLTRYLAKECGPVIRANCICPGTIDPEGEMRPVWEPIMGGVPLGRVGRASEVEGAALFLASSASSYVTGQVIFVDGGRVNTVA